MGTSKKEMDLLLSLPHFSRLTNIPDE